MIRFQQELSAGRILYQFWGRTSNCYLLVDTEMAATYLIDCGMPSDTPSLLKFLKNQPPLKRVVCTHFHVDHISGWIQLKEVSQTCKIWFHEKARPLVTGLGKIPFPGARAIKEILIPCMKMYGYRPSIGDTLHGALFGTPFKKGFPNKNVHYFTDTEEALPGFLTLPTPGHRPDETSFLEPHSGAFISGDFIIVITNKILPNTFVSSKKDQQASLKKIKQLKSLRFICPGHGQVRSFSAQDI